jgi:sulfur relay (sulfurtransferase) DsrF/TusC family protein
MEVAREALDLLIALTAAIEATLVLIDNMVMLLVENHLISFWYF